MSSIFAVVNHQVVVPILPYQQDKLRNLAPGLAKKQLPSDQFCHKLGGYPLLVRVLSAEQDSFPLYGGVWSVNLNCSVIVCQPAPGSVIQAKCLDKNNGTFNYMNSVAVSVLKPRSVDDETWVNKLPEYEGSAKLVILGYGNSKPLTDVAPKNVGRRMQLATTKPEPVLYARLESDPEDRDEYTIPYGEFKPVKPKTSTRLSETEVEKILSKATAISREIKQEIKENEEQMPKKKKKSQSEIVTPQIKVEVEEETPRKKKKSRGEVTEEPEVKAEAEETPKKKKKVRSEVTEEPEVKAETDETPRKKRKSRSGTEKCNGNIENGDLENEAMEVDLLHSVKKKKKKKDEVYIKEEPISPERESRKRKKLEDVEESAPKKKKKRDYGETGYG